MALNIIPDALGNSISQFLEDRDNARFITACRAADNWVRCFRRQAESLVNALTRPLYRRYARVRVELGRVTWWPALMPMCPINLFDMDIIREFLQTQDILEITLYWNNIKIEIGAWQLIYEINNTFDRLPVQPNVRALDLWDWPRFRNFYNFPGLTSLRINITRLDMSPQPYLKYPDLPELKSLTWRCDAELVNKWIPENWGSVEYLETDCVQIPETYCNLVTFKAPFAYAPTSSLKTIERFYEDGSYLKCDGKCSVHTLECDPELSYMPNLKEIIIFPFRNPWD